MTNLLQLDRWFLACCVVVTICCTTVVAVAAPGTFSFDPSSVITIAAGQETGKAVFLLKLVGDPATLDSVLELEDRGAVDRPDIGVRFEPGPPNRQSGALVWFVTTTVTAAPVNTTSVRYLTARYGGYTQVLSYTLSNKPAGVFAWKVKPPAEKRRWHANDVLRFTIDVGPVPATDVRLLNGSFLNSETLSGLNDRFSLCVDGVTPCPASSIVLAANKSFDLLIKKEGDGTIEPGQYSGTFTVVAAEAPAGDSFPVTLYVSDTLMKIFGGGLIVLGIVLSFIVGTWTQRQAEKNARLRPAVLLKEEAERLGGGFSDLTATGFPNTRKALGTIVLGVSQESLRARGFLGSVIPPLKGAEASAQTAQNYEAYLGALSKQLTALAVILQAGNRAVAMWAERMDETTRSLLDTAQTALDNLAIEGFISDRDKLSAEAEKVLVTLRGSLNKAFNLQDDPEAGPALTVSYASQRIAFETEVLNLIGWLVFGFLSLAVGGYLLIVANPGFGQLKDLLYCLLWGFGVPAAGEKLATINGGTIAQGFGLTMTKVV